MIKACGIRQCFLKYSRLIEKNLISNGWFTTACRYLTCSPNLIYANTRKTRTSRRFETAKKRAFSGAMTTVIAFPFTGGPSHSTKSNTSLNKWKTSDFPNPVGKTPNTSSAFLNTRLFQLFHSAELSSWNRCLCQLFSTQNPKLCQKVIPFWIWLVEHALWSLYSQILATVNVEFPRAFEAWSPRRGLGSRTQITRQHLPKFPAEQPEWLQFHSKTERRTWKETTFK